MHTRSGNSLQASSELVGRETELALMLAEYKRADAGSGSTVLLRGDGGIGKSRLAGEATKRARAMGATVLIGHATRFDQGLPYAIFREILANAPEAVSRERTSHVAELRSLLEPIGQRLSSETPPSHPRDILTAATALFRNLAEVSTLVVLCEDLHEADADSASLFMHIARHVAQSRVLLIGCVRTRPSAEIHEVETLAEQLALEGRGAIVDVGPLDRLETRALVAGLVSAHPDEALLDLVFNASRGNPFFATEATRALVASSSVVLDAERLRLVHNIRPLQPKTALVHRFFQVGSVEARVARVLSAFDRVSLRHLHLVASIAGVSEDRVAESFDRLVADHLLVRLREDGWGFAHSILRDALYDDIGPAEQRRIHQLIAEHLKREIASGIAVDVTELAIHCAESADPGDEGAVAVLVEAGRATASAAPLVSAQWFKRAVDLLPPDSTERPMLVGLQAASTFRGSRPEDAARLGREALKQLALGPARTRTLAETVNGLYIAGRLTEAVHVIDEEERRFGPLRGPLLAQRSHFMAQLGQSPISETDHARHIPDASPAELAITMIHDLHRALLAGDAARVAALVASLDDLRPSATPRTQSAIYSTVGLIEVQMGDSVAASRALDAAMALPVDDQHLSIGGQLEAATVLLAFLQGHWDDALALIPDVLWSFAQSQASILLGAVQLTECEIYLERGELRRAAQKVVAFRWDTEAMGRRMESTVGKVALANGDIQGARTIFERALARADATGYDGGLDAVLEPLIDACLADDDRSAAIRLLARLEALAHRTQWPLCGVRFQLARATVLGDVDAARAARETSESLALTFDRARACLVAGTLNDDSKANLLDAYHCFVDLGAVPWRQRAAAEMRARGIPVPRLHADPESELTQTESTLVRLVSEGRTNREIASLMHYSIKTVEVYLTRLYAKTGLRSRVELARAVDRGDVLSTL